MQFLENHQKEKAKPTTNYSGDLFVILMQIPKALSDHWVCQLKAMQQITQQQQVHQRPER